MELEAKAKLREEGGGVSLSVFKLIFHCCRIGIPGFSGEKMINSSNCANCADNFDKAGAGTCLSATVYVSLCVPVCVCVCLCAILWGYENFEATTEPLL